MANYDELKQKAAEIRDEQGAGENTALRVGGLLGEMVAGMEENAKGLKFPGGFIFGGWVTPASNADTETNNKYYIAWQPGVYTNFKGQDGQPLNVQRPVALMRNLSAGTFWFMNPLHGLYEFSQLYAFNKTTGFLGGSVCLHAFRATETFRQTSFPVALAFQTQLQSVTKVAAMEGAGVVFPRESDPSYASVKNIQRQAQEIEVCDNYVIWISTNDCTAGIDIPDFKAGLDAAIATLKQKNAAARIFLVAPNRCRLTGTARGAAGYAPGDKGNDPTSQDTHALIRYAEAVCDAGQRWNLPVLNLFNASLIDIFDTAQMMDGTHPLPAGYALLADLMAAWVATGYSLPGGTGNGGGGGTVTVDRELSATSANPVENRVITAEINTIKDKVFPLTVTVTGGGTFEKGTTRSITVSWTVKQGDTVTTADAVTVNDQPATGTSKVFADVKTTTIFTVKVTKGGKTVQGTTTATFVAPMYFGFAAAADAAGLVLTDLIKQAIKTSPAGTYALNNATAGHYLWLCVPNSMTIKKVTSGGFDVPMEAAQSSTTAVDTYKCYRSSSPINQGTMNIVVS